MPPSVRMASAFTAVTPGPAALDDEASVSLTARWKIGSMLRIASITGDVWTTTECTDAVSRRSLAQ
jgi:hypothetical protein